MNIKNEMARLLTATAIAIYLKFLLPPTAVLFFEIHHATGIDFLYWGYSIFKVTGYYFGSWEYQGISCILAGFSYYVICKFLKIRKMEGDKQ